MRRALVRQHSRFARRTITKSREMQAALPRAVRHRNTVLPNGVDAGLFRPLDRDAARRELGWPLESYVALFAGNPGVPRKRYWLAEAAVDRARRDLDGIRLEVAYLIDPDRMPLLMNAADCLLLTSSIEGSPNVVKEALMCNLPVVATAAGDVAELLEGVEPSYVCEASEVGFARAVVQCLRRRERSNGRERSARLDGNVVARPLLELYQDVAPGLRLSTSEGEADQALTSVA